MKTFSLFVCTSAPHSSVDDSLMVHLGIRDLKFIHSRSTFIFIGFIEYCSQLLLCFKLIRGWIFELVNFVEQPCQPNAIVTHIWLSFRSQRSTNFVLNLSSLNYVQVDTHNFSSISCQSNLSVAGLTWVLPLYVVRVNKGRPIA